jgi:hypothetical protein
MQGTQGPTNTDVGGARWPITDEVIRLRAWGTEHCHVLPTTPGDEWVIGSGPACWLRLEDSKGRISRQHARLSRKDDKWVLRDAGSKNGMVVDGTRRDKIILEPGLEIWFGGIVLVAESSRWVALRSFLGRILGWTTDRIKVVDQALHMVRNAATRQTALVLCGDGDMVSLARTIHRHAFGAERPFIVCDPRRKQSDESVRAAENYRSGVEALQAARSGSLCIWNNKLPRDFADVAAALKDPDARVQLIVCAREAAEAEAFGVGPITIPPLSDRRTELSRIVEEYIEDAIAELRVPRTSFPTEDRDWVFQHASASLPEIEKATLRLLAIREAAGNMNRAAARLGMGRWSLSKWVNRRKLPVHVIDTDE